MPNFEQNSVSRVFDYSDKSVFVAGGTSGINLGIAEAFARSGARVAVASRKQANVDEALRRLASHGGQTAGFVADVRDYQTIASALEAASKQFGPIDVLISGAAGNFPAAVLGMSANGFKTVIDIDLLGTFNVFRAGHAFLRKPGAAVISISAPQAFLPMAMQAHVCAAKAGVDMLTRVLAIEWGRDGVRVNSIVPGPIKGTEGMARLAPTSAAEQACRDSVPLGRFGTLEDVANAALYLASDLASFVTGVVLPVDGGWSLAGASAFMATMVPELAKGLRPTT